MLEVLSDAKVNAFSRESLSRRQSLEERSHSHWPSGTEGVRHLTPSETGQLTVSREGPEKRPVNSVQRQKERLLVELPCNLRSPAWFIALLSRKHALDGSSERSLSLLFLSEKSSEQIRINRVRKKKGARREGETGRGSKLSKSSSSLERIPGTLHSEATILYASAIISALFVHNQAMHENAL